MNSSRYMDKQITGLSELQSRSFLDDEDDEPELLSFDLHPVRSQRATPDPTQLRGWSSVDPIDSVKIPTDKDGASFSAALISEIDRKIREYIDDVLHAVGGLSARVSQLETRSRQLENAIDDLKESIEFTHRGTEGKLRELQNILDEVQDGIRNLRDKQEIAEAQVQLAKLKAAKVDQQSGKQTSSIQTTSAQEVSSSAPQHSNQPLSISFTSTQQLPTFAFDFAPNLPHQNFPSTPAATTAPELPAQLPHSTIPSVQHPESNYLPPMRALEMSFQKYQMPSTQHMQGPPPVLHQPYQPSTQLSPIQQPLQLPQACPHARTVDSHTHPPLSYQTEVPHLPSQSIQTTSQPPGMSPPAPHQFYLASSQQIQDQPSHWSYSEFSSGYLQQPLGHSNLKDHYSYGTSPSSYGGSATKPLQLLRSSSAATGSRYSPLPTAKVLPYALPTASPLDGKSGSAEGSSRVPIDDVIEKVVAMGFRRDLVRATIKKLSENGQPVDLNAVLDKLMNGGNV